MSLAALKLPLILLALAAALGAAFVLYPRQASAPTSMTLPTKTFTIGVDASGQPKATVVAEVATTDAQEALGLGGRTSLADGKGMWFVFSTDDYWPFWMKDTLIPLDMIWVAADGSIVTIAHDVEPSTYLENPPRVIRPTAPARYVLEVPAGYAARHDIVEGDKVVL